MISLVLEFVGHDLNQSLIWLADCFLSDSIMFNEHKQVVVVVVK